jgi:Cu+-exporting ATPase
MDQERKQRIRYYGFAAFVGCLLALNLAGIVRTVFGIDTAILITLLAGYKTFFNSISSLLAKEISADLALCIAVIAALSAGEYRTAAEAIFIVLVGEGLESYAAGRTEAAIQRFIEQQPRSARVVREGRDEEIDAGSLVPGDLIVVRAGERIPADGLIEQGSSSIDESSVTGEPFPRDKHAGDEVFSGTLNGDGWLRIRVTRAGEETTLSRVARLVEEARQRRAPVERLADRYARYFLPALLLAGALTYYFTGNWLRTVAVLIVACPCALILATPTAMVAAIGGLARQGILVRGGAVLQAAANVDTLVLDKTGTVTEGRFEIVRIIAFDCSEDAVVKLAATAERAADHVLARIIVEEAARRKLALPNPEQARALPGRGAECICDGRVIRAGNASYLAELGIRHTVSVIEEADACGATAVLVAEDGRLAGAILFRDRLRAGVAEALAGMRRLGIARQIMLTGDRRRAAEVVAREAGISQIEAELLPEQKLDHIRRWMAQGGAVAMIGDGINDAPALAAAHVGIAVAGASDLAAEAADAVYLLHSLEKMPLLFEVSRNAIRTAWQNIIFFAGGVNAAAVLLCATGQLGPIAAAFTHQASSFLVMMNSLRLLRAKREGEPRAKAYLTRLRRYLPAMHPAEAVQRLWLRRRELLRPALLLAGLWYLLSGFYMLGPDETGVIQQFGRTLLPYAGPGLHYKLPWPVERLTRLAVHRVRVAEIGFRSRSSGRDAEPTAYEWNIQHRSGRFQRVPEESLMLTGDQNMIELNATVHYSIGHPNDFLFRQLDGDATVRAAAESVLQTLVNTTPLDEVLTTGRTAIEQSAAAELQRRLDRYGAGIRVIRVKLEDVHPSLEVVDAFRTVSEAFEEKNRLINEAEAYRNEQVALARGKAQAALQNAEAYTLSRKNRAAGDAMRFALEERAFHSTPGPTETRLYLETIEKVLPGKKKLIVDESKGRRHFLLLEDGVELPPSMEQAIAEPARQGGK